MRILVIALAFVAACGPPQTLPDGSLTWQADGFLETLPATQPAAFILHARTAVFQNHGATYVDDWDDTRLLELAGLWCDAGANVHSDVIGGEMDRLGFDVTPGRNFVPPPPVDELITRVADIHSQDLCPAL